ncbi:MAG: NADH-quinone oxidoreductase subunit NuoF [Chloroflexota bacterium]
MTFTEIQQRALTRWEAIQRTDKVRILVGAGTCGRAAGAGAVIDAIRDSLTRQRLEATLTEVGCIGLCYAEPLVDVVKPGRPRLCYGNVTPEIAVHIIEDYVIKDDPRPDLALGTLGEGTIPGIPRLEDHPMMAPQVRITLRNCGYLDPEDIDAYLATGGYSGLVRALTMVPEAVIAEIKESGLRGRGGAGFPTGLKWEACRNSPGTPKYLVCNADEGDPGAFMNRALLEGDPHAVLEGMLIGAHAVGAQEGYIYVRAEYPLAIEHLKTALSQMRDYGLVGDNILGSGLSFHIKIKEGAGAFVCGEETALLASIEGKPGIPRVRPPFPAQAGLWGKPTVINNVETWGHVSAIMQKGAPWFAGYGTKTSKGTKTFSLVGKVARTGLIEVPMGMTLRQIVYDVGGGTSSGKALKAVQTGGPSGGCLPASLLDLPVDYESLAQAGAIMGSGGMIVADEDTCMVDLARYFLSFTQTESCGKCVPCRLGTRQMLLILEDITAGRGTSESLDLLAELAEAVKAGSLCGLGQTTPNPVLTTLRYFREEYEAHIHERRCPALVCKDLISYYILPEKCRACLICLRNCPVEAISGGKWQLHVVDQEKCTKCGTCLDVCPQRFSAVVKLSGQAVPVAAPV